MSWGFILGVFIGGCLGVVAMGIINATREDKRYIELNHYYENGQNDEVEE